jgi:glutamate/tyrosine decarboxylase-like PLP-dependent enzyme
MVERDSAAALEPFPEALFPAREVRERIEDWLTRALGEAVERTALGPVLPDLDFERFRSELAAIDFETPRSLEELLAWSIGQLEHGVVHMTNPRYFGLFNPAPTFPAQCADRIAGAFNPQLASSGSSPAPVAIEAHVIRAVARRAGLPAQTVGHFTTSGSEANYTALICALTRAEPAFARDGLRAFQAPVTMYTSRECQPAWFKIVHQCGLGRAGLRLVDTDGHGRLDIEALRRAIASDRQEGIVPLMISSTAGTTGGGMIDPLEPCAAIARAEGLWHHVDAAWGGAALASERLRHELAGLELADSVTIDAHKWFATPMGCGMFITRWPAALSESFSVAADFMPSNATGLDPYLNSVQWSRRFMGLRLFISLAAAGWSGYGVHVERAAALITEAERLLRMRGWAILNDSRLAVLCAVPPAGSTVVRDLVRRVLASGRVWVAAARFEGRDVVRVCATHGQATLSDVEELVDALVAAASAP